MSRDSIPQSGGDEIRDLAEDVAKAQIADVVLEILNGSREF